MAIEKEEKIYRTIDEQVGHLTEAHIKQLGINEEVNKQLLELSVATNQGGYNLVRFSFQTDREEYYRLDKDMLSVGLPPEWEVGDFVEITTKENDDIPAYGYVIDGTRSKKLSLSYTGDFKKKVYTIYMINTRLGSTFTATLYDFHWNTFGGSKLADYDANECKRQVFRILNDLTFGSPTQYVSFDLNRDGKYNFVFIGVIKDGPMGEEGKGIIAVNSSTTDEDYQEMRIGENILITELITPRTFFEKYPVVGDIFKKASNSDLYFIHIGNIRGERGVQGIQGIPGIAGKDGKDGVQLYLHQLDLDVWHAGAGPRVYALSDKPTAFDSNDWQFGVLTPYNDSGEIPYALVNICACEASSGYQLLVTIGDIGSSVTLTTYPCTILSDVVSPYTP